MTALGLFVSRMSLIAHELIGHGGAALAVGGRIVTYKFFWFGGGWIRYAHERPFTPNEMLFIALGGILLEIAAGGVCFALSRRRPLGSLSRVGLLVFGTLNVLHGLFYLATGTFSSFGDGKMLAEMLGPAAQPVAVGLALACVGLAVPLASAVMRGLAGAIPAEASRRRRFSLVFGGFLVAAAVHGGLAYAERELERDETYAALMKTEQQRALERVLTSYRDAFRAEHGRDPTPEEVRAWLVDVAEASRPFPFKQVLGVALALAVLVGGWRGSRARDAEPLPPRLVAHALGWFAVSLGLVLIVGWLAPDP